MLTVVTITVSAVIRKTRLYYFVAKSNFITNGRKSKGVAFVTPFCFNQSRSISSPRQSVSNVFRIYNSNTDTFESIKFPLSVIGVEPSNLTVLEAPVPKNKLKLVTIPINPDEILFSNIYSQSNTNLGGNITFFVLDPTQQTVSNITKAIVEQMSTLSQSGHQLSVIFASILTLLTLQSNVKRSQRKLYILQSIYVRTAPRKF